MATSLKTFGTILAAPGELQPDCMFARDEDGSTKDTLVYVGKYDEQKTWVELMGDAEGVSYELAGTPGGLGRMKVITGTGRYVFSNSLEPGEDITTYDWLFPDFFPIQRPIITSHKLDGTGSGSRETLVAWMNEPDAGLRKAYSYTDAAGATQILSGNALTAAKWVALGRTTVEVWLPAVERMRRIVQAAKPQPDGVGGVIAGNAVNNLPGWPDMPEPKSDYQWRKVSDRTDPQDINDPHNRVWIRRERWIAEITPETLYPGGAW